jgi:hypothetical protein
MIFEIYDITDKTLDNLLLVNGTFTLSSYKKNCNKKIYDKKIGQITWNGLFPDRNSNNYTNPNFLSFTILGGSGIYSKVTKVIIDYTNETRKVYFIGKR